MGRSSRVGVVGGGLLGSTLALRLRDAGHEVTILERADSVGGLASPEQIGDYTWDRFYHVILLSDRRLIGLLEEMGIADRLRWGVTRTGFYVDGELISMSSSLEFLRFPPLNLLDKIRLGATIFYASRVKDWKRMESVGVGEWLRRWSGERVYRRIWLPLLKSKLGENHAIASAAFIWATIRRMYAARRSGLKREMFGYVDGGYDVILRRLGEYLGERGIEARCGSSVEEVRGSEAGARVTLADGTEEAFDEVVLTLPCRLISKLCPGLTEEEHLRLQGVTYQGIACASVLLRKPLADYYVTNITEPWVPFTAVIEMTALVDRTRFGGNALVYLPRYLTQDDPFWNRSDEEIEEEFLAALERMYPRFGREDVLAFRVSRARDVLAIPTLNYSEELLPPVATSLDHVHVLNSAQIAAGTLNVNETIGVVDERIGDLLSRIKGSAAKESAQGTPATRVPEIG